jgi:hypothetical protein
VSGAAPRFNLDHSRNPMRCKFLQTFGWGSAAITAVTHSRQQSLIPALRRLRVRQEVPLCGLRVASTSPQGTIFDVWTSEPAA